MSFGGTSQQPAPSPTNTTPLPPNTPTHADPSVISAGLGAYNPATGLPQFSTAFKSFIGGAGGLGRPTAQVKRTLIGGGS